MVLITTGSSLKDSIDTRYKISDIDDSSQTTYTYFGKVDKSGNRIIMRLTNATNAFRYAKGTANYSTNWTNRASLSYDYYNA